jgi:hypothetical protein
LAAAGLVPKSSAIVITILVTVVSIVALLLLFVWGMSVVGQWLICNGSQFQTLYPTSTGRPACKVEALRILGPGARPALGRQRRRSDMTAISAHCLPGMSILA